MESASVLITGAGGFVGSHLSQTLAAAGWHVVAAHRQRESNASAGGVEHVYLPLFAEHESWERALKSVRCVIHLAAQVHVLNAAASRSAAFHDVNVEGTRFVAQRAARAGVRRFVYMSSIKVNGEGGGAAPYRAQDKANPQDPYARSKYEAEELLRGIGRNEGMQTVIIRPPLIYGPGVRANFLRLLRLAALGVPLPFGSIDNRRSMLSLWNLAHFMEIALVHPAAGGSTWLVADGEDLSTPDLLRRLMRLMDKSDRLFALSPGILRCGAKVLGFGKEMHRLCESLVVDSTPAAERLAWRPVVSVDEGLARTVGAFKAGSA